MPQLKEILHAIVSDIAEAKSLANHTSVRRAELYKSHPLLSSLPAPTMRLRNVTVDLPMIIMAETPGLAGTTADPSRVADNITLMLRDAAQVRGITLSEAEIEAFRQGFVRHTQVQLQDDDRLNGTGVRETFSRAVDLSLTDMAKASESASLLDRLGPLRHDLKHAAAAAALERSSEPTLTVDVRSDQIKVADPKTVTRIHFELTEDGLEWQRETDAPKRKLVPE
jgi:hypothetical protein